MLGSLAVGLNFDEVNVEVAKAGERVNSMIVESRAAADESTRSIVYRILIMAFFGLVLLCGVVYAWFNRVIVRPLKLNMDFAEKMGKGDLSTALVVTLQDEPGQLGRSMNAMAVSLKEVADLATEISGGNLQVRAKPRSQQDEMMHALDNMAKQLTQVAQSVRISSGHITSGTSMMSGSAQSMSQGAAEEAASSIEQRRQISGIILKMRCRRRSLPYRLLTMPVRVAKPSVRR